MIRDRLIEILCIEDNPADRYLIREFFRSEGKDCRLSFIEDGGAALEYLKERPSAPPVDLILLDLNLPKRDGREVLQYIKGTEALRHIPVLVLTGSSDPGDISKTYNLHANAYLVKPGDLERFEQIMRQIESFWLGTAELSHTTPPLPN